MKLMKTLIIFSFIVLPLLSYSQCNDYFPYKDGNEWTYESFDKKGKTQGSQTQKVTKYESSDDGYKAIIQLESFDKKGKELTSGELEMICSDGVFYFDMKNFVPNEQMQAMGSYEMEVESDNLSYPSDLSAGKALEDGSITIKAKGSPIPIKITVNIVERKVVGVESINTAAGSFDAVKITSKSVVKNQMGINMTFEFGQVEWISKEVGMVKSETYRNDKLSGYMELKSFSK